MSEVMKKYQKTITVYEFLNDIMVEVSKGEVVTDFYLSHKSTV